MPKYKVHLCGGAITFFLVLFVLTYLNISNNLFVSCIYLISCLIGSLFPDIDTKSKIQKYMYYPLFTVIIISMLTKKWILASFISVIALIPILANHRRLTHRLWFVIVIPLSVPILIYHINQKILIETFISYLFFVVGAISHLLLDFGIKRI
jgi:membrane-bound metal-dependent hydrolase YbcI (DUF457 family)